VAENVKFIYVRGVFKKRPNFLNSVPTSTEGALRLLSAPRGRFWQQTAICGANGNLLSKPAARCVQ